ncbi:hypothetical protein CDAR_398581 [Caerostris darwini]|uniref:Uncharacterized protein n=1 Tax=Caerostris darwini TaxID=1538125 RepID=A0AAV4VEG0_9ARAC|nr:hypothetical protein CDAR_398581 [Caerostris darwini]
MFPDPEGETPSQKWIRNQQGIRDGHPPGTLRSRIRQMEENPHVPGEKETPRGQKETPKGEGKGRGWRQEEVEKQKEIQKPIPIQKQKEIQKPIPIQKQKEIQKSIQIQKFFE